MTTVVARRPRAGEVRVRINAIGSMIVAVVEEVGASAEGFVRGDRVVYPRSLGEDSIVAVDLLVGIPKNVTDRQAAELLAPGLIAYALLNQVLPMARGQIVDVRIPNPMLKSVVGAWVTARGGTMANDELPAEIVYDQPACKKAVLVAGHRQGRLQQTATEVFQAIRAGVFKDVDLGSRVGSEAAA